MLVLLGTVHKPRRRVTTRLCRAAYQSLPSSRCLDVSSGFVEVWLCVVGRNDHPVRRKFPIEDQRPQAGPSPRLKSRLRLRPSICLFFHTSDDQGPTIFATSIASDAVWKGQRNLRAVAANLQDNH